MCWNTKEVLQDIVNGESTCIYVQYSVSNGFTS
jgi:hypothetical protein